MVIKMRYVGVAAAALLAFLAVGTTASAQPNKCNAAKIKCASKKKACRLNVYSKAYKAGAIDPAKLQKCEDKFDGGADPLKGCFEKAETKNDGPCATFDDTAAIEGKIDAFVADVLSELDPVAGFEINPCTTAKIKCVRKKNKCILNVQAKAAKTGLPPDTAKLAKCKEKFDGGVDPTKGCFEKAETKYLAGCASQDDTAALEAKIDAFDADVVAEITGVGCAVGPGDPCPIKVQTEAAGTTVDLDTGWTGQSHDAKAPTMGRVTFNVSGCANAVRPCGLCSVSGPIANDGGVPYNNQRCNFTALGQNNTNVQCTGDGDCAAPGTCEFFFGSPLPLAAGGVSVCVLNEVVGSISGTTDIEGGTSAALVSLTSRVHLGPDVAAPCPRCVGGLCDAGPRMNQACTVNGVSALFGAMSFDCPPDVGSVIATLPIALDLRTGAQTRTLSAANPTCRAGGFSTLKCFCDTCNNLVATPCDDNADCVAVGATICGGRRCIGGPNGGAPCTVSSECFPGSCSVPGKATQPNECDDDDTILNNDCGAPGTGGGPNEAQCILGPSELFCNIETFRGCAMNADCTLAGDSCGLLKQRECFPDNGNIGGSVTVSGVAGPAACLTANPTLGSFFCIGPTTSTSVNSVSGLPGLGRVALPSTATFIQP